MTYNWSYHITLPQQYQCRLALWMPLNHQNPTHGTLEFNYLFIHHYELSVHHRDKLGTGKLSPLILCSAVHEGFCLTYTSVCPSYVRALQLWKYYKIDTLTIPPYPSAVYFYPFQCTHEQVNLIHDCRHTSPCKRRQDWQETDRWQMYFGFSMKLLTTRSVDHFEQVWHSCWVFQM